MGTSSFTFKKFKVEQDRCAMKVGVDGVMLGAWADCNFAENILDIGTGTGVVAIMLAQRNKIALVDAVEVDGKSCAQATDNFKNTDWNERLTSFCCKIQDFAVNTQKKYDLIVSNPPYFSESLKAPDIRRTVARHAGLLPQDDLISCVKKLINEKGKFVAIFPYLEGNIFIAKAAKENLFCNKKLNIKPNSKKQIKRILMEFGVDKRNLVENTICIDTGIRNVYTEEYKTLTRDFYLKF